MVHPKPELRLVAITDLDGYLEPCGCTSRPLGGIDRMAAEVQTLLKGTPSVVVATGSTLFGELEPGMAPDQAETQETWKADTLGQILSKLEIAAVVPGPHDFLFGVRPFVETVKRHELPVLAADWQLEMPAEPSQEALDPAPERTLFPSFRVVKAGDRTIGLVGVVDLPEGTRAAGTPAPDPVATTEKAVRQARDAGAEIVIALVSGDRRMARRISGVPGLHLVVLGGVHQEEATPPAEGGSAHIVHAGRQGQGLIAIDLFNLDALKQRTEENAPAFALTDWSDWSRETSQAELQAQIAELERRAEAWAKDDSVNQEDVARQKTRLAELKTEHARLERRPDVQGPAFAARYVELPPEALKDANITQIVKGYDKKVNAHNREAFANWTPPEVPEGVPHYVGSKACATCHGAAYNWWRGHAHGRAYQTLVTREKQFNLSCVGCHVTGYGQPGGATVTHNLDGALVDVGCETCHGAGSQHVVAGDTASMQRNPPETLCVQCHNEKHSDGFVYEAYRATLIVPGHGLPPAKEGTNEGGQ